MGRDIEAEGRRGKRFSSGSWFLLLGLLVVLGACQRTKEEEGGDERATPAAGAAIQNGGIPRNLLPEMQGRKFRLHYGATLQELPPQAKVRVWLPVAPSTPHQQVRLLKVEVPGEYRQRTETKYGNRCLYFEAEADAEGQLPVLVEYEVIRAAIEPPRYESFSPVELGLYLQANALVPLQGTAREKLLQEPLPATDREGRAREIFNRVLGFLEYAKPAGEPWGRGDVDWVCESGFGNCCDFHSLFIALCRSEGIPARFEIGFTIPPTSTELDGYHCWASFADEDAWKPVDLSEAKQHPERVENCFAQLPPDRMRFTVGRDLVLEPPQAGPPLNFWIHPYAEVDGLPHQQMQTDYRVEILDVGEAEAAP